MTIHQSGSSGERRLIFGQFPSTSEWYWGYTPDTAARAVLKTALDSGISRVDTAPAYGWTRGEEIVGEVVGSRMDVAVMTKCGLTWEGSYGRVLFAVRERGARYVFRTDLRPKTIRRECVRSLRRLRRDHIEIYQCHWPDPTVPLDDSLGELDRLRAEGKIGGIGLCNYPSDQVEQACRLTSITSVQEKFNVLHQDRLTNRNLPELSRSYGFSIFAYAPFEQGLLCGEAKYLIRHRGHQESGVSGWFSARGLRIIRASIREILPLCTKYSCALPQLLLAWTLAAEHIDGVLIGTRSPTHIKEDAQVRGFQLDLDDWSAIAKVFRQAEFQYRQSL